MAKTKKKPVVKDHAFFSKIGKMGGAKTKRRMLEKNPNYYSEIGDKGGRTMLRVYGREFYSKIGKMGKRRPAV